MQDTDLVTRASGFHPWDAMTPMALSAILKRGPFRSTAETGCGGSTIVLSHASDRHTAFAIDGKDRTDRKSTRLNSSHLGISYAVFCLKKKKVDPWLHF